MTLNIMTVLVIVVVAAIWVLASYGVYVFLGNEPAKDRNWLDKTLPRRIVLVLIAPLFWIGAFLYIAYLEIMWDWLMRKVNQFNRWRERKPQRREKAALRRRNFIYSPQR